MEKTKQKLPWLSVIFTALICLKIIAGLGYALRITGLQAILVWFELIIMVWVALALVNRKCKPLSTKVIALLVAIIIFTDISLIAYSFSGLAVPSNFYAQLIGAELTYLMTIAYCLFSKRFKEFKCQ